MATGVGPSSPNSCGDERGEGHEQEQPPTRLPRVIRQPHHGGYDCEFVERPHKAVQCECPVCLLVLREPHQVTCCGYTFCATCVTRVQEDKKCCPTCSKANFEVFSNKGLKRTLNEYRVYCCQRAEGCDWVGELGELDRHLNLQPPPEKLLVGCQFSEVDCTYCGQPFQRRYVQAHQSDECLKRPYACQHCNRYAATYEEVAQNHWPVCSFFPLSCPNNCELVLQRQEVEHHVNKECPLTIVKCVFHAVGCQGEAAQRDMPSHISDNLTEHMSLLQAHMMTHPGENMATYLWLMMGSLQKVTLDNASVHCKIHKAQETLQGTQEAVAQLEASGISQQKQNESLQQAIDECQEQNNTLRQQKRDLTKRLTASEQKIQALDTQLVTLNNEKKQLHHKLEECSTQLGQHQQNTTLAHKELQKASSRFSGLWILIPCLVLIAACILYPMINLSDRVTTSEQMIKTQETTFFEHQQTFMAVKDELTDKVFFSEQRIQLQAATLQQLQNGSQKLQEEVTSCKNITQSLESILMRQKHERTEKLSTSEQRATQQATATKCKDEVKGLQQSLNELERKQLESEKKLTKFKDEVTRLQQSLNELEGKQLESEKKLTKFKDEVKGLQQSLNELERKQLESEKKLTKFKDEVTRLQQSLNELEGKQLESEKKLTKFKDEVKGLQQSLDELERKQLESEKKLMKFKDEKSREIKAIEQRVRTQNATLHQHQKTLKEMAYTKTLPFEFTMTEFEQYKKASNEWYSHPFYTHTDGYRMCIRVDANGVLEGKGTHLSVFGYLMKGVYDDDLQWPFQGAITFQLLNQMGDSKHHEMTVNFAKIKDLDVLSRVTSGERAKGGWGFRTFIAHTKLGLKIENWSTKCQFLKDDQLKFRIKNAKE